jgi:hypothetical protein
MNTDNNIHEDSGDKVPNLSRSGNSNPFGPGSDYFENFQNKIMSRVDEFEELRIDAPFLSNIPIYNPFDVPAGYFDELPSVIQKKCGENNSKSTWLEWIRMVFRPNFAIPVLSVLLIAFAAIYYIENKGTPVDKPIAEEINVDEELQNIDESTIVDALADAGYESSNENENEKIKTYLIENNVDETNINYEL